MGTNRNIDKVELWNRSAYRERLSNYQVSILDDMGNVIVSKAFHTDGVSFTGESELWTLTTPVNGQIIKVQSLGLNTKGNNYLSLAEVKVLKSVNDLLPSDSDHLVFQFNTAGSHTVSATHSNGETGTLNVIVKQADFSATSQDLLSNSIGNVVLKSNNVDSDLKFEVGNLGTITSVTESGTNLYLQLSSQSTGPLNLAARLYEGGPILGVKSVNLIAISDALQNDLTSTFYSSDFQGYYNLSTPLVATNLPAGGQVKVTIFRAGVTFPDGTKIKWINVEDFINDTVTLNFLFPVGMTGGYCHYLDIYDRNGAYIARR